MVKYLKVISLSISISIYGEILSMHFSLSLNYVEIENSETNDFVWSLDFPLRRERKHIIISLLKIRYGNKIGKREIRSSLKNNINVTISLITSPHERECGICITLILILIFLHATFILLFEFNLINKSYFSAIL